MFFTSDSGPKTLKRYAGSRRGHGSPGPLRSMKLSLDEGGYSIPAIARWPGYIKQGTLTNEPICGADMSPAFQGRKIQRAQPLHWHYFNPFGAPRATLREGEWKVTGGWAKDTAMPSVSGFKPAQLAEFKSRPLTEFELFHLPSDLGEKNDLAQLQPKRLAALRDKLINAHADVCREGPDWM